MRAELPANFVEEWTERAQGMTVFGKSVNALSREELIAVIAFLNKRVERTREDGAHAMRTLLALRQPARR